VNIDVAVIDARLRELDRRLKRIAARKKVTAKALAADEDLQDILARNLAVAIQACLDIAYHLNAAGGVVPPTAGEAFDNLARAGTIDQRLSSALTRAAGFRNVLVHEYTTIDWKIVLRVVREDSADLAAFGRAVVALLDRDEP
jgi:uncharacterized protein YutE (UPF0331/DUF86 family)